MEPERPLPPLPAMVILSGLMLILIVVLALIAQPFVPALVWSLTLAVMFAPVERRLRARTGSPSLAAAITLLLAAIMVVIPVTLVASALLREIIAGAQTYGALFSPAALRQAWPEAAAFLGRFDQWFELEQVVQFATTRLGEFSGQVVQQSASGLVTLLLTFYFLFYLLRDKASALAALQRLVPLNAAEFHELVAKTSQTVFASVYATAAVAALQGLLGGLMFWMLDLPAPIFWGVVMGLLAIVPFLGAFVVWVPAAIGLALAGEWGSALVLTVWGTLVVGLIDNIVYPILVGKRLSLHPMVSFIAIIGGLVLFGAHGIVLGPLVVALAQALLHIWRVRIAPVPS